MSDPGRDSLTPLQRAALALREMRARLDRLERDRREPIAIVGLGCRFPGGVSTPDEFWALLRDGRDASGDWPRDRWDVDRFYDPDPDRSGRTATRRGSFLGDVDRFDAPFFDISAREAESLDPQQRLLLEVTWEALEHAGVAPDSLRGSRTGVFVGMGQNDYARRRLLAGDVDLIGPYDGTGNGFCFASGRLSYTLGLHGPNVALDTACSASLVSVHMACQSLRARECDLALAGGVQLILSPEVTIFLSRAHALSPDGRCRTFDAGANGYGRGEGCGMIVLKRLSDAQRDGDTVLALVRGSAVNHGGTSSGLTVPSAPAQQTLIADALASAGLQPHDIDYIEAHGTATSLGDPIEIAGLEGVFAPRVTAAPLRLGSVKTNVGHLEAAAGIAGLIKVVLALQHAELPPHLHVETLNPAVRWDDLPFRVTTRAEAWPAGARTRRAGVSSFGISGTNAHVVLEEAPAVEAPVPEGPGPYLLRLAARSATALQALAARYAAHVSSHPEQTLAAICVSANVGRAEGRERAAVIAESRAELVAGLTALSNGDAIPPRVVRGTAESQRSSSPAAAMAPGESRRRWLERLAATYVAGRAVDWRAVADANGDARGRRVALPTYPWQRQRYWIEARDEQGSVVTGSRSEPRIQSTADHLLHPLVHRRVDSPVERTEIEFESTIDSANALAAEHRVLGTPVLPAGAFVEMALAAARAAGHAASSIEDVRFLHPLTLGAAPVVVRVVLTPAGPGAWSFVVYGKAADDARRWMRHASGRVRAAAARVSAPVHLDALLNRMSEAIAPGDLYDDLRQRGVVLGPLFQVLGEIRHGHDEVLARLNCRPGEEWDLDPAVLDGCSALHAVLDRSAGLQLQARIGAVDRLSPPHEACWVYMRRETGTSSTETLLLDAAGRVLVSVTGQQLARADAGFVATPSGLSLYELDWVAAPDAARLAELRAAEAGFGLAEERTDAPDVTDTSYEEAERELEALSLGYVSRALRELDAPASLEGMDVADLMRRRGVVPRHRRLLQRLFELAPGVAVVGAAAEAVDLAARARDARARHPIARAEFELLERCGSQLVPVLRGERDPLPLLFPARAAGEDQAAVSSAASLYSESHAARVMHRRMRQAVSGLLAARQDRRPLRVLEIGAGSGATTEVLLGVLPADAEYWFTDIAPIFLQQARARFGDPRLRYRPFDVERDAGEQGVEPGFDLVIASNVLHATRSLAGTMSRVRQLLRAGGSLVVLEGTTPRAWIDLVFGLTEGWWLFSDDDLRPRHPLVSAADWRALLDRIGFDRPGSSILDDSPGPAGQALLVATRPLEAGASRPAEDVRTEHARNRHWLVVAGAVGARDEGAVSVAAALRRRGASCEIVASSVRDTLVNRRGSEVGVIVLPGSTADVAGADPDRQRAGLAADHVAHTALAEAARAMRLVQDVASAGASCPIWFVTRDVHGAGGLSQAPIWGIARALALEAPELWGGVIDVDERGWLDAADLIASEVSESRAESQVVYRDGVRLVPRVRSVQARASVPLSLPDGTYLITGGFGALGLATAEFLASRGARRLCLVGRRGLLAGQGAASEAAQARVARLEAQGVTVLVFAADVASEPEMRAVIEAVQAGQLPLRGVVHAAGVTGYGLLTETGASSLAEILHPKVTGGWLLHELTRSIDLQFFICYSSMVSVWGARGQGPYVAANHFLDALARHRRAAGLPAVTINWGPLSGGGMVPDAVAADLLRMGVRTTPIPDAVRVLDHLLDGRLGQPIAVDIDWSRFREAYATRGLGATFDFVQTAPAAAPAASLSVAPAPARDAVTRALPSQRRDVLLDEIRTLLRRVVVAPGAIDATTGLFDLGLDSLSAMELRRLLEQGFGVTLPATILFDCGTLEALTDDMLARLGMHEPVPLSNLDLLSDDALEARLLEKLQELN